MSDLKAAVERLLRNRCRTACAPPLRGSFSHTGAYLSLDAIAAAPVEFATVAEYENWLHSLRSSDFLPTEEAIFVRLSNGRYGPNNEAIYDWAECRVKSDWTDLEDVPEGRTGIGTAVELNGNPYLPNGKAVWIYPGSLASDRYFFARAVWHVATDTGTLVEGPRTRTIVTEPISQAIWDEISVEFGTILQGGFTHDWTDFRPGTYYPSEFDPNRYPIYGHWYSNLGGFPRFLSLQVTYNSEGGFGVGPLHGQSDQLISYPRDIVIP